MKIGLFTDTYFPQVSGVATSIKTLRDELIKNGHQVYIFTTTDPAAPHSEPEKGIYRFKSVPFVSFTDRRIAVTGWVKVLRLAKQLQLDIVHNQTEFSLGMMGKMVAKELGIPCLHTYHTMYQDYLHYIANGRILKPKDVAKLAQLYMKSIDGVIAPSERVLDTLLGYGVTAPIKIIPTGVNLDRYLVKDSAAEVAARRARLGYAPETPVLLSLSRLAFEKNIQALIEALPDVLVAVPDAQLLIVGDGPARASFERQVRAMNLTDHVTFVGQVDNDQVYHYYQLADVFVSASDSESQGLTYDEALASDLPLVVMKSDYTAELIDDPAIGTVFQQRLGLVNGIVYYLKNRLAAEDQAKRQQKLHEISAAVFADRVLAFYQECQARRADEAAVLAAQKNARRFPFMRGGK